MSSDSEPAPRFPMLLVAGVVLGAVTVAVLWIWPSQTAVSELVREGRVALEANQFDLARQLADRALAQDPESQAARLLAGAAEAGSGDHEAALMHYEHIPDDGGVESLAARCDAGDIYLFQFARMSAAEVMYRRAVALDPDSLVANERLAYLLGQSARSWEATEFLLARVRQSVRARGTYLSYLCFGDNSLDTRERFLEYQQADPADPAPAIALAQIAVFDQQYRRARELLAKVIAEHPDQIEAQVKLGRLLQEAGDNEAFERWHRQLPPAVDQHPGTWLIRGFWCRRHAEPAQAARCFWESLKRDPNNPGANYQLGRLLAALDRDEAAVVFLERSRLLNSYVNAVKVAEKRKEVEQVVDLAERLGLAWEAWGWAKLSGQTPPQPERTLLTRTADRDNPAFTIDLADVRLPDRLKSGPDPSPAGRGDPARISIRFRDTARPAGIDFRYVNGGRPREEGIRFLQESTGGGVAVLDYDADGWPDLYVAQGCRWPPAESQDKDMDRLFKNLGDGHFSDVTEQAGLQENRFSQGVAVGDINNDGFPDLYVGNIGANRLYLNNTDGTFRDVTQETGSSGVGDQRWTTSCLVADLNGDGHPDIYSANYLGGPDVFTRVCRVDGREHLCAPQAFPAAADRLYLGDGAGGFAEVTDQAGLVAVDGAGLGLVAVNLGVSGQLSLFVANDARPNFLFINRTAGRGRPPRFDERALRAGVALNRLGQTEACMGVAAGDSDGDGRIDLFVTNFEFESNTLYRQVGDGTFVDATQDAGLSVSGLPLLGFGTQFLDADLDGRLDLFVTNGHTEKDPGPKAAYEMPPQFYWNQGQGTFGELESEGLGEYFSKKYLGRGVARLDVNRDGLPDLVVTHLDAPLALLENETPLNGRHFLVVHLRGTLSGRDAIGSRVEVQSGDLRLVRQLTAGDGYLVSNQRVLLIGLGEKDKIDTLTVRWPSGGLSSFNDITVDREVLIVEQATMLLSLPRAR